MEPHQACEFCPVKIRNLEGLLRIIFVILKLFWIMVTQGTLVCGRPSSHGNSSSQRAARK